MKSTARTLATWPEGVFARYLTAGGATVDLTILEWRPSVTYATLATCIGCQEKEEVTHWRYTYTSSGDEEVYDRQAADQQARDWAQSHAEGCRAMRNPDQAD